VTSAINQSNAIGIMGGTFDPIHLGHLRLAWEAQSLLNFSCLEIMPCHLPPHRDTPASHADHRFEMAKLACADTPAFHVNDWEMKKPSASYTVETLEHLRSEHAADTPIVFIMGMDAFHNFCQWHRWQDILSLCHLWVAHRPGCALPNSDSKESGILRNAQTTDARALLSDSNGKVHIHNTTALDISATQLRHDMKLGIEPRFLIPDIVWKHINYHQLYQCQQTSTD